ncbi:protein DpdJ [Actinosynnema pretiosum]|uniref:DEAD/DEAH box helicase n=1 Tax=Actinosynnema pretiosum TaxID=42197 RepID=A0A290Z124_9PSEU|nr:protein DpdJ [Actinosynnema pretiosum]ATE52692.1 DEAD/DEAH box helicase [Actinosynnema pretiosum]
MTPVGKAQLFVGQLLDSLEDRELPLLSWGITSGTLSQEEVHESIEAELLGYPEEEGARPSKQQVFQHLLTRGLLFQVPDTSPPQYRTRFAEALRLTSQLRQLFPWMTKTKPPVANPATWWLQGKTLVSDYRLHVASRRYPARSIPAEEVLGQLSTLDGWDEVAHRTVAAQIGERFLARFQVDATRTIYSSLGSNRHGGVIIGAGTGSGKTLAFYLPSMAAIRQRKSSMSGVHTLALYPRTELLRDQLREALATTIQIEKSDPSTTRPLRIGVLYGDTPKTADHLDKPGYERNWKRSGKALICPYLTCPRCEQGQLLWSDVDRRNNRETLTCSDCRAVLREGVLALTRDSLKSRPDLLFTTTEMLNRGSTDPALGPLLGWSGSRKPSLVLLDEVHTYSGTHGAQVGLLLRRWRHAVGRPVTFVGLSATLKNAAGFFSQLTGLRSEAIDYIEPSHADMEFEGREYSLALRGDPLSGTSLVSTSIQTAMLFGRVLEVDDTRLSPFGSTGFLFTDDLDVTNRFYDYLRSAEGEQSRSGRVHSTPLAALRALDGCYHKARYADGQSWDLVEKIGHLLGSGSGMTTDHLPVARTTSQDGGVSTRATLIVATAALEVGFNDPRVGLVVQHKAPHDAAAFIQRRGRAGRKRGTRPITVAVLSDYGRDRLAYQGYETLFAPELSARDLPLVNRHVQKIQATQAMLDWLSRPFQQAHRWGDLRKLLSAPAQNTSKDADQQQWVINALTKLLQSEQMLDSLTRHLQRALALSEREVEAVLWEQPRSLLLSVVPTIIRRLESNWKPLRTDPGQLPFSFLPEYVTKTLFEPLNLPEVQLDLPFETPDDDGRLPIAKALREAVPGRVSKRYGYLRDDHRTWLAPPADDAKVLALDSATPEAPVLGYWRAGPAWPDGLKVIRPFRIKLEMPPPEVLTSSQGFPLWATEIVPPYEGVHDVDVPRVVPWHGRVLHVGFGTHAAARPVAVRRMTFGASTDVRTKQGGSKQRIEYSYDGEPAALGFQLDVDAMRVEIARLDVDDPAVRQYLRSPQWRSTAFHRTVSEAASVRDVTDSFQRDWLALAYITAYSLIGVASDSTPEELWRSLRRGNWREQLPQVISVLYREEDPSGVSSSGVQGKIDELRALSHLPEVVEALDNAGRLLFEDDVDLKTGELAKRAYRDTMGAAVLGAALRACRNAHEQDLLVDVVPGQLGSTSDEVWLSETSVGGIGVVEQLAAFYATDPQRFWSLVANTLQSSEYENTDVALTRLLRHAVEEPNGAIALAMSRIRAARSAAAADQALQELLVAWTALDGSPRRTAVSALAIRLLRPGSNRTTDAITLHLVDSWKRLEERLGVDLDARVIACAAGSGALSLPGSDKHLSADQVFSMLWPRGAQVRSQHLKHYQPYGDPDTPQVLDRLLVSVAHDEQLPAIDITAADWRVEYAKRLTEHGAVWLVCPVSDPRALGEAVARIPAVPVDSGVLRVYGNVTSVVHNGGEYRVRVDLKEAEQ